jgi:hypothetical protein
VRVLGDEVSQQHEAWAWRELRGRDLGWSSLMLSRGDVSIAIVLGHATAPGANMDLEHAHLRLLLREAADAEWRDR